MKRKYHPTFLKADRGHRIQTDHLYIEPFNNTFQAGEVAQPLKAWLTTKNTTILFSYTH